MKHKYNIDVLLHKPTMEFQKFHAKAKIKKLFINRNSRFWPKEWKTTYYKAYLRLDEIILPKPDLSQKISLIDALNKRESSRIFSKKPLRLQTLSNLLNYSAGFSEHTTPYIKRRYYPSGGARFPLEVYVISLNTELEKGIYHYYLKNHSLEKLAGFRKKDVAKITSLPWASDTGCLIVITGIFKRNVIKYGNRGYRHVLVEAGHMAQNFYLISSALGINISGIGGYLDDYINGILDVDGLDETVIYLLGVGEKP